MKRRAFFGFLSVLVSSLFVSCASTKMTTPEYLGYLDDGDYKKCIAFLEKKNKKNNDNLIRDNFDIAMMKHYQKDYDSSLSILNTTDRLMEDSVTKSITKDIESLFLNDNATEYAGTPYEYVYINIFNALNYYNQGNTEEAAVEVRRLNEKQRKFLNMYGEIVKNDASSKLEIPETYRLLKLDTNPIIDNTPSSPSESDIFRDSPTARYLSIVFAMMDDSVNNSWNISSDTANFKVLNPDFDIDSEGHISEGMGRLDVLAFSGLIGRRGEKRVIIGPFPGIQFPVGKHFVYVPPFDLEFVYPAFPPPQEKLEPYIAPILGWGPSFTIYPGKNEIIKMPRNQVDSIRVVFAGSLSGRQMSLSLLEDYNYAVQRDVNTKAKAAYGKSIKRSLVKKFTAVAASTAGLLMAENAVSKEENIMTVGLYAAAYLSAAKAIDQVDKTEQADIRQVYALPAQAYASGIELPAGKYSFKVQYLSKKGVILGEESFTDIEVKSGKTVLVESTCQK